MSNDMNKDSWIEDVMGSVRSIRKPEVAADFYEKVQAKLNRNVTVRQISMPLKQWAAAAILLLAVNVGSIVYFMDNSRKQMTGGHNDPLTAMMPVESTYNY